MQTAQAGDRVQVHYVKRFQDGSVATSRERAPVEVTVGADDPRLPGLGLALVGLAPGASTKISVPLERAYGPVRPDRIRELARRRFPKDQSLPIGAWVRFEGRQGRHRNVRILEVRDDVVVVDANHRRAGLAMELEVELLGIKAAGARTNDRLPKG